MVRFDQVGTLPDAVGAAPVGIVERWAVVTGIARADAERELAAVVGALRPWLDPNPQPTGVTGQAEALGITRLQLRFDRRDSGTESDGQSGDGARRCWGQRVSPAPFGAHPAILTPPKPAPTAPLTGVTIRRFTGPSPEQSAAERRWLTHAQAVEIACTNVLPQFGAPVPRLLARARTEGRAGPVTLLIEEARGEPTLIQALRVAPPEARADLLIWTVEALEALHHAGAAARNPLRRHLTAAGTSLWRWQAGPRGAELVWHVERLLTALGHPPARPVETAAPCPVETAAPRPVETAAPCPGINARAESTKPAEAGWTSAAQPPSGGFVDSARAFMPGRPDALPTGRPAASPTRRPAASPTRQPTAPPTGQLDANLHGRPTMLSMGDERPAGQRSSRVGQPEWVEGVLALAAWAEAQVATLCHGRCHPSQIVLGEAGPIFTGWAEAHWGVPEYDLATLDAAVPLPPDAFDRYCERRGVTRRALFRETFARCRLIAEIETLGRAVPALTVGGVPAPALRRRLETACARWLDDPLTRALAHAIR